MCGIAGYFGERTLAPDHLARCLALMRRRGPDHAGVYHHASPTGRNVYLLHSRLSIIDLDPRSHQPFRLGERVIAYNGELYNYLELRERLAGAGRAFRTTSDTEVLMAALEHFGEKAALDLCEGMWAFALYDEAGGSLWLCRDRFGEKPLYLHRDETGLYFGSEVKFLRALVGRSFRVNENHIYRYLVNGYKALYKTTETFFEGVEELPPGSLLRVTSDGVETSEPYWRPSFETDESLSREEAVQGVRERLIRSVKLRLRADVPLAFCMSGGIDSNSLISIAKRCLNYDVHGFTVVNEDARYAEWPLVELAVRELGIRHTPVPITSDQVLENLKILVRQHDAPIYTISYYVQWLLMREVAAAGYRVSVSGTGADELLTGYYDHHNLYLYEIRNSPEFEAALAAWHRNVAPWVRNPYLRNPRLYFDDPSFRAHVYLNNEEFARYLTRPWMEDFAETQYVSSLLRNRMLNELFHEAVPVILHEDDLNAMFFSIENRSPYLDRDLFEFCCRIPTRFLVRNGLAKAILRDAMAGIVPEAILTNPRKVGFNAPVFSFIRPDHPETRAWLLDDGPIYEHVRKPMIEKLLSRQDLPNSESKFLFYFVNAKMFLELFAT